MRAPGGSSSALFDARLLASACEEDQPASEDIRMKEEEETPSLIPPYPSIGVEVARKPGRPVREWVNIVIMYLVQLTIRSSMFLLFKVAFDSFTPFFLVTFRNLLSGVVGLMSMGVMMWISPSYKDRITKELSVSRNWLHLLFLAVVSTGIGFGMYTAGQIFIPPSTSSVLTSLTPGLTLFIGFLAKNNPIRTHNVLGLLMSIAGIIMVLFRHLIADTAPPCITSSELIGGIIMNISGSIALAGSMVYIGKFVKLDVLEIATFQTLFGGVCLLPLTLGLELKNPTNVVKFRCTSFAQLDTNPYPDYSWLSTVSADGFVLFVALALMALIAPLSYSYLVQKIGAVDSTTVQYVSPIIGTFLPIIFLDEWAGVPASYKFLTCFGALITLFGVFVGSRAPKNCSEDGCWRYIMCSRMKIQHDDYEKYTETDKVTLRYQKGEEIVPLHVSSVSLAPSHRSLLPDSSILPHRTISRPLLNPSASS